MVCLAWMAKTPPAQRSWRGRRRSPHKCAWRQDEYTGAYHTECGHLWEFTEGGLVDNDTRYCPYCGGQIVEQPTEGEEEDK